MEALAFWLNSFFTTTSQCDTCKTANVAIISTHLLLQPFITLEQDKSPSLDPQPRAQLVQSKNHILMLRGHDFLMFSHHKY